MPEIKNTFIQGKMNKDLDERLVPNGQYRHAENIEVATAEDSGVGVAKNIVGNHQIAGLISPSFGYDPAQISGNTSYNEDYVCVGSVKDEKTNKLYWFISKYDVDAIIEYDVENEIALPVVVDQKAGTTNAVLKFSGNIITGINIIDNLLFWTDNNSEPKKINIDICKAGTDPSGSQHTRLSFKNGSFEGVTLDKVGDPSVGLDFLENRPNSGAYFWIARDPFVRMVGGVDISGKDVAVDGFDYDYSINTGYFFKIRHYRNGKFLGVKTVRYFGNTNEEVTAAAGSDSNGTHGRTEILANITDQDWQVGDVFFGDDIKVDIEEKHVTVIKPKPLNVLSVKINHKEILDSSSTIPNLFETKFPRFSYRYRFLDGEYSAFAPFTQPVFNAKYTKDTSVADANITYNKDNAYDVKEPHNKAMINSIHSVELTDFVNSRTPEDVEEIEILYKQEGSNVIYSIGSVKQTSEQWHADSNTENVNVGYNKDFSGENYMAVGGFTKGKYLVETENIYAALPANQLLRPWDNVPKKALAQEITGNRIVYGNYVQNYNLNEDITVTVDVDNRDNSIKSFDTHGLPSIKSQRNYQLGVVYCDKYGRETPVFTSRSGAVNIPWQDNTGNKNASKSLQISVSTPTNFPEWVDSLKFYIKENSNPYYNILMERAWVTKKTYELDNSEGHMWLCFPSSDRNKITEDDYIVLKKKIGTGENQIDFENKYKVIDIQNEAPDAIKFELVNWGSRLNKYGTSNNNLTASNGLFNTAPQTGYSGRPDIPGADVLLLGKAGWGSGSTSVSSSDRFNNVLHAGTEGTAYTSNSARPPLLDNLYVSWKRIDSTGAIFSSKKYKVIGGWSGSSNYVLKLNNPITKIDADIAHINGDSSTLSNGLHLHPDLMFQVERRVLKDAEDFSGKFFVKISKNQVTNLIETGDIGSILDRQAVSAEVPVYYWQDDVGESARINFNAGTTTATNDYGLTNYNGFNIASLYGSSSQNHIHHTSNKGGTTNVYDFTAPNRLKTLDYVSAWSKLKENYTPTFFVDSMYMASGQSDASNEAKFNCVTWSGATLDHPATSDDSSWSYPPFKRWIGTIKGEIKDELISTSPALPENEKYDDKRIDGWVGPLQKVNRDDSYSSTIAQVNNNHVNGLEGFVTTTATHSKGPRRWFSGITGSKTEHGVGVDTFTYASDKDDIGRHFMHLSFFAPGKDLHDGDFSNVDTESATTMIYGDGGLMANLQGIWGGGVFTGESLEETFGTGSSTLKQIPMEGNYDGNNNVLEEEPGPGVGFGYDLNYRELHERQWDPTFNSEGDPDNKIRDFIRNIYPGQKLRFHKKESSTHNVDELKDNKVYTIKSVKIKKLYNHTSWRKPYNRYFENSGQTKYIHSNGTQRELFRSVEEQAMFWLDTVEDNGVIGSGNNGTNTAWGGTVDSSGNTIVGDVGLMKKIQEFGAAHNRRVCYIIELDENPTDSDSALGNPLDANTKHKTSGADLPSECMSADSTKKDVCHFEFLEPVQDLLLSDLNKFPAIWEIDPKKQEVDLDIYYEASNNIPVYLNENNNELIAPIGCKVEILDAQITGSSIVQYWENNILHVEPGFEKGSGSIEIDYSNLSFKFTKADGSYNIIQSGLQDLDGGTTGVKKEFIFREDIGDVITHGLSWSNCFSFGNGIESNRVRDDFNEPFISNGVKASTTTPDIYKEERRKNGLIYSGIYNSNSGINNLNQFIQAEKITKDVNPTYGSIQKLFSRDTDLVTFCEDKVVKVLANKDALFNADGNTNLTATENVLGQTVPFVGEYGISTNPESFVSESYRAYFTDKQRGSVLRLSRDGLTPISKAGMNDWFRDNLSKYNFLIGTYDNYKEHYNLSLSNLTAFSENIIETSFLNVGEELEGYAIGSLSITTDSHVNSGDSLEYLYNTGNIVNEYENSNNPFDWAAFTYNSYNFRGSVRIIHHAKIDKGALQPYVSYLAQGETSDDQFTAVVTVNGVDVFTTTATTNAAATAAANAYITNNNITLGTVSSSSFTTANYGTAAGNHLLDDGWMYDPRFNSYTGNLFGSSYGTNMDAQVSSKVIRNVNGTTITEGSFTNTLMNSILPTYTSGSNWFSPDVEKPIYYNGMDGTFTKMDRISSSITRNDGTQDGQSGAIVFDRCAPHNSHVTFQNFGTSYISNSPNGIMNTYVSSGGDLGSQSGDGHDTIFNGEELFVQFTVVAYQSSSSGNSQCFGYNKIKPRLEIRDGNSSTSSNIYCTGNNFNIYLTSQHTSYNANQQGYVYASQRSTASGLGSDFEHENLNNNHSVYEATSTSGLDFKQIKYQASTSGTITFSQINNTTISFPSSGVAHIRCGGYFKFKTTSQNSDGTSSGNITEQAVINNLRIRISNAMPAATTGYVHQTSSGDKPYRRQLWEIKDVLIKKGYGLIGPHQSSNTSTTASVNVDQTAWGVTQAQAGFGRAAVAAVPPEDVPAWTEIQHLGLTSPSSLGPVTSWQFSGNGSSNVAQTSSAYFGPNYHHTVQYGAAQNTSAVNLPPIANAITYVVPQDWPHLTSPSATVNSPFGTTGPSRSITGADASSVPGVQHGVSYNRNNQAHSQLGLLNAFSTGFNNPYINFSNIASTYRDMTFNITGHEWQAGNWYLVDVEFDNQVGAGIPDNAGNPDPIVEHSTLYTKATTGSGVQIVGVADDTNFVLGNDVDPNNGVGKFAGSAGYAHVALVPVKRTEYGNADGTGDNKTVLRAIFKTTANSSVISGSGSSVGAVGTVNNIFVIRFRDLAGSFRVNKVITKKLNNDSGGTIASWVNNSGSATYWTFTDAGPAITDVAQYYHAFDKKHVYYSSGKLNWNVPVNKLGFHMWTQEFGTSTTSPAPTVSQLGWELSFTVSNNVQTNNFSGKLKGFVAIDDGTSGHKGVFFSDIDQVGNYSIKFNFDENVNQYNPSEVANGLTAKPWEFLRGNLGNTPTIDYSNTGSFSIASTESSLVTADVINKIQFQEVSGQSVPQEYAISDIKLTDSQSVFTGGRAGSWNFTGFDTSLNNYIFWNTTNQYFQFDNCPSVGSDGTSVGFININQQLSKTINRFEKYEIKFQHSISGDATLSIYYYNSNGFGFKISDINENNTYKYNGTTYTAADSGSVDANGNTIYEITQGVVIGGNAPSTADGSLWSAINNTYSNYSSDLKNSFVISIEGEPGQNINSGIVDNITMKRVYTETGFESKTVTFSEKPNGWVSFKSFVPENGLSVSKKYFTFDKGQLYEHYVPKSNGLHTYTDTSGNTLRFDIDSSFNIDNYNNFYNQYKPSLITAVLNDEPSFVKNFKTLSYEGSIAKIIKPTTLVRNGNIIKSAEDQINSTNAIAFQNGDDTLGWKCEEIKTDLDIGSVEEFIKKEGKWFNYIKGKTSEKTYNIGGATTSTNINTELFSTQGIGIVDSVDDLGGISASLYTPPTPTSNITTTTSTTSTTVVSSTTSGGTTSGGGY